MWGELRKNKNARGLHHGLESMSVYSVVRKKAAGREAGNQNTKKKKKRIRRKQYTLFLLLVENIRYITLLCFSTKFLLWFFVVLFGFVLYSLAQMVKNLPVMRETRVHSLSPEHSLEKEKEIATHSSILAWRIPGTEEPCGLQSLGSLRVGHN